jgi:hypothetical protein
MRVAAALMGFLCTVSVGAGYGAEYAIKEGKGYAVCEAVKAALDRLGPSDNATACNRQAARTVPGLHEPPWQDLDVKDHWDLFLRFNRYDLKPGNESAFSALMESWGKMAEAGTLRMQIVRIDLLHSPLGPQTLVRVIRYGGCGGVTDDSSMHLVKADLSDVDRDAESGHYWLQRADLEIFKDKPYIVYWNLGDDLLIASASINPSLVPFCTVGLRHPAKQSPK